MPGAGPGAEPIALKDIAIWGTIFEGALYPVARGVKA